MKKICITLIILFTLITPTSYIIADLQASAAEPSTQSAISKALPATVTIVISKKILEPHVAEAYSFGDTVILIDTGDTRAGSIETEEAVGAGSGFIITHDGYIVTNKHVVLDPEATYTVVLADGNQKLATVVYRDPVYDIAILKISGSFDTIANLGSSKNLKVGQPIIALGNAYGETQNSISVGTISAFNKNITAGGAGIIEELKGLVQSSANIVPGYSGGPLIDSNGNVVGINVAKDSNQDNTSFSIPIDIVKNVLQKYLVS